MKNSVRRVPLASFPLVQAGAVKVSVIIPTWNRASTIRAAVESALAQDTGRMEVLVCDDGSTDDTRCRIEDLGDARVRWLPGERRGRPAVARNRGIRESRGDWLAFLDSDDEWLPGKLERQLALACETKCTAVCSNAHRLVPGAGIVGPLLPNSRPHLSLDELMERNEVICSSAVIHRELLEKVVGFPESPEMIALEDYALWLRVACFTEFAVAAEPLVVYTDSPSTSIRSADLSVVSQRVRVLRDFLAWGQGRIDGSMLRLARGQYGKALRTLWRERALRLLRIR